MVFKYLETLQDLSAFSITVSLVAVGIAILYLLLKNKDLPPGPTGLPYVGYWPFLQKEATYRQLTELGKTYGDVFSFSSFGHLFINLGSIPVLREAYTTKSDCFASRMTEFNLFTYMADEGLLLADGERWTTLRKFFVLKFKEQGLTAFKDDLASAVYDNVSDLVKELRTHGSKPVNIVHLTSEKCFLILRRIMFNDDAMTMEEMKKISDEFQAAFEKLLGSDMFLMGNFTKYVIHSLSTTHKEIAASQKRVIQILEEVIKRRESTFQEGNVRDLVDCYLKERNDRRRRGDLTAKYFTNKSFVNTLGQFVADGSLSVAVYIGGIIHALLEHPEEQEKIYEELLEVVGVDRQPSLGDRSKLPYTIAFLQEMERTTELFPLIPGRTCTRETTINGYRIPKGAVTLINIWQAHYNPKTYKNPMKFDPSRFIATPEKNKEEHPIAFGIGRRSCIGEAFVNMQGFLFTTTLVKNFRLTLPEGADIKSSVFQNVEKIQICAHPRDHATK